MNTGFFGKIPATGDFVAANLPRTFIDRWDRWISMELRARPDEHEDLDDRVWRFVIQGAIFVACVLLFRRGIIGEIANKLRIRL